MKFTGAVLVFIVTAAAGTAISLYLKKRMLLLEKTSLFIGSVRLDFEYTALPLNRIIEKYAQCQSYSSINFISICYDKIKEGTDFPLAWKESVSKSSIYSKREVDKLVELGSLLGTSDLKSQINMLQFYEGYFNEFYKSAKNIYDKYGEASVLLGLFIGFGMFILLI